MQELIERLDRLSGLEAGWYANVGRSTGEQCCAAMKDAATALRDLTDRREGMEEDLYQAVLVAYRRGAVEWTRLNYPKWFDAISAGREVCPVAPPDSVKP